MRVPLSDLRVEILPQPDDITCGPTCLHAVYRYYGDSVDLTGLISEVPSLEGGGTLAVHLGNHALSRGYQATIFTYNTHVFDPTWLVPGAPPLAERLQRQMEAKESSKLRSACAAYLRFLGAGGRVRHEELSPGLIRRYLNRGVPLLTGLSSTYLYQCAREVTRDGRILYDDVAGEPQGHFVVLGGYAIGTRTVRIADPYLPNPVAGEHYYDVPMQRLIAAILLGIMTYDANLLVIEPVRSRSTDGEPDRRRPA